MSKRDMTNISKIVGKNGKISYKARVEYFDDALGKRRQISQNFKVHSYGSDDRACEAAIKWRDAKRVEVHQGIVKSINNSYTIDEIFEKTIGSLSQSSETKRKWRLWYKKYVLRFINGNFLFSKITWDKHIKPSLDAMVNDCSQDMINRVKTIWGKMCLYAFTRDLTTKNEILLAKTSGPIRSKAVVKTRNKKVNMEDLKELLKVFEYHKENERLAFVEISSLKFMAYLGMRPAEVFVLEKDDIDLKNRTIHIYKRLGSSTDEKYVATSLGNKGYDRLIPYPSSLDALIDELIEKSEDGKLFTVGGIYINSNTLSGDVRRISKGKVTPYMLRHAFSNNLVVEKKEGGDKTTQSNALSSRKQRLATQNIMGHSSVKRTIDYATDISKDELEISLKNESNDEFNEEIKAVNSRAKELDELGLCDQKSVQMKKNKNKK